MFAAHKNTKRLAVRWPAASLHFNCFEHPNNMDISHDRFNYALNELHAVCAYLHGFSETSHTHGALYKILIELYDTLVNTTNPRIDPQDAFKNTLLSATQAIEQIQNQSKHLDNTIHDTNLLNDARQYALACIKKSVEEMLSKKLPNAQGEWQQSKLYSMIYSPQSKPITSPRR